MFMKGDAAEHVKAKSPVTDDTEMPARASDSPPALLDNRFVVAIPDKQEEKPLLATTANAFPKETLDADAPEHIITERERKSFSRGVWGYAEQVLRDRGIRKDTDKDYNRKIAELTNVFLGVLEGDGILKRGKDGTNTWYVPVSGKGIDRIIEILRTIDISSFIQYSVPTSKRGM